MKYILLISFAILSFGVNAIDNIEGNYAGHGEGELSMTIKWADTQQNKAMVDITTGVAYEEGVSGGCGGSIEAEGHYEADKHHIKLSKTIDDQPERICQISVDFHSDASGKQSATLQEGDNCSYFHGASCAFEGTLTKNSKVPQFADYAVNEAYIGKNHALMIDNEFSKTYRTRLKDAIQNGKPSFAGHYLVTRWGCGSGGCNTGAIIDAITGKAYPFPVMLSSVFPLKPQFEKEEGQELLYKLNSRLMIFAGNLSGGAQGEGMDTIEFYEFKDNKFIFLKSVPYGKALKQ